MGQEPNRPAAVDTALTDQQRYTRIVTPLILLILAAMWAAVLLPPYLRDRNETKAAGSRSPVRNRIDALTSSLSGGRSYLPARTSGQAASQVPLPPGAREPVRGPEVHADGSRGVPQSSAVQILTPSGRAEEPAGSNGRVAELRPRDAAAPTTASSTTESVAGPTTAEPNRPRSAASIARQRRRDVLHTLLGLAGITLVAGVALGGPVLFAHLLVDAVLIAYVYLLIQRRKVSAEQEIKVAFLPHGGAGASATALLEEGGGWNPGSPADNIRVLRAKAN